MSDAIAPSGPVVTPVRRVFIIENERDKTLFEQFTACELRCAHADPTLVWRGDRLWPS